MERNRRGRPRHPDVLTPAEWRVLDALREGGTNAEIAARLGLSADTVKTHISNMLAKLELRDRRALAAWRPDTPRHRLGGVLAVPAALWSVGRPLAWVGVGAAALAGVAVVVVALVALEVIVEGDPAPPAAVAPPPVATPTPTTTPTPSPTVAPTATPVATPAATVAPTATPTATPAATPDPPTATPAPEATPTGTPEPSPTAGPAPASSTATAVAGETEVDSSCVGIECRIVPAPDSYVRETWEAGEQIDYSFEWWHGFFFLDTETGRTEGYRDPRWETGQPSSSGYFASGPWLKWEGLLVNRRTGSAWRWPDDALTILATSEEHVFVVQRDEGASEAHFSLLDSEMRLAGEFLQKTETPYEPHASFSPDGRTIVLVVDFAVAYLVDVESVRPQVLLEGAEREGWEQGAIRIKEAYRGPGLLVKRSYWRETDPDGDALAAEYSDENRYFTWGGDPLPGREESFWASCRGGQLSPDGRYVVWQEGAPVEIFFDEDWVPTASPWLSVVIADAHTCEPRFRVRSALKSARSGYPGGSWLSDSSGYVFVFDDGGSDGAMIVRVTGEPEIVALPSWGGLLVAAPTGDGRYFANFSGVWDAWEDRWVTRSGPLSTEVSKFHWVDDHTELLYASVGYLGHFGAHYLLLAPKLEFPPFSEEVAFRVRGSDVTCADLLEEPRDSGSTIGCAFGGVRLTLAVPDDAPDEDCGLTCYPSARAVYDGWFVYVRTEDGLEGWIPLDSLEHD